MRIITKIIVPSCLLLFLSNIGIAQTDWPLKRKVNNVKDKNIIFTDLPAFSYSTSKTTGRGRYHELQIQDNFLSRVRAESPQALQISIPSGNNQFIRCELVKTDLGSVRFTMNNGQPVQNVSTPLCYQGIVVGEAEKNNVMLTINDNYMSLVITFKNKSIQITQPDEADGQKYRLYNSAEISFPDAPPLNCGTIDNSPEENKPWINAPGTAINRPNAPQDKCVFVFVECFDSLYQWRGSNYQNTINYVYELFNNVATGYLNELINIKISTINVWTTTDPYRGDNRTNALADLAANYQDNFWGNICVGLDYSIGAGARSGLAGAIGRAKGIAPNNCPTYTVANHPFCYNDIDYGVNVQDFPTGPNTTQGQVYLVMHEIGHLLGSAHTQWCGWLISTNPVTFGALDNCAAVEGTCSPGPPPPANGGTIMSYCVGTGQFVSFNNGFGTLPGNAIRNFVDGQACIVNCSVCPPSHTVGNLPPGSASQFEASGTIVANGIIPNPAWLILDAGTRVTLSPGFRANNGSQVKVIIDGCGGVR